MSASQGFNQRGEVVHRLRPLGDGAQARRRLAGARRASCPNCPAPSRPPTSGGPARPSPPRLTTTRSPARPYRWGDYSKGERIDHVDGVTVEEAEHQIATRLYQNTAKVHFNQFSEGQGRFGRRLIYGGHVISLARALSFNGLANAFHIAAINGGRHVAPLFAGDTVFAWSEILDVAALPGRADVGALRMRTIATKNRPCADFPVARGRGLRAAGRARPRLLGASAALKEAPCACPMTPRLLVIDVQQAIDDPKWGPRNNPDAERAIAALLAAWRAEGLPIVHIRHDSVEPDSPYRPERPGHAFKPEARPLDGETVIGKSAHSAFVGTRLEEALDALGATTLVVCGVLTHNSLEATRAPRRRSRLSRLRRRRRLLGGRRRAISMAACGRPKTSTRCRSPASNGEYAEVVNCATALAAARLARSRERAKPEGRG